MPRHLLRPAIERAQDGRLERADRVADAAERAVFRAWAELLAVIADGGEWMHVYRRVADSLARLGPAVGSALAAGFLDNARDSHADAVRAVADSLPRDKLLDLQARRRMLQLRPVVLEADGLLPAMPEPVIEVGTIFPAPSIQELARVIFQTNWQQRIAAQTRLADPGAIASIIANGLQQGFTPAKIAREVRPLVQGVQSSARRVARTESMRVAGEMQLQAFEQMGDMVVGYQVHAVKDRATRREHWDRDGFEYFKRPGPGQRGLDQMPRPPLESQRDGFRVAHNCRCYLTPILAS